MNPKQGEYVIVYLRNGLRLEGNIVEWTDGKSVLKSTAETATIIIQKTIEDVLFVKITNFRSDYEELKEKPIKEEDDIKRLAELKNELNDMDRADLRERMSSHRADGMREVSYGLPWSNVKIPGAIKRPGEETPRADTKLGSELQGLFPEKRKGNRTSS